MLRVESLLCQRVGKHIFLMALWGEKKCCRVLVSLGWYDRGAWTFFPFSEKWKDLESTWFSSELLLAYRVTAAMDRSSLSVYCLGQDRWVWENHALSSGLKGWIKPWGVVGGLTCGGQAGSHPPLSSQAQSPWDEHQRNNPHSGPGRNEIIVSGFKFKRVHTFKDNYWVPLPFFFFSEAVSEMEQGKNKLYHYYYHYYYYCY